MTYGAQYCSSGKSHINELKHRLIELFGELSSSDTSLFPGVIIRDLLKKKEKKKNPLNVLGLSG